MRLLHARTLEPHWFEDRTKIPPYAILSHTWGNEEISYEDIMSRPLAERLDEKSEGIFKIRKCAEQAMKDGLEFIWVDTCCIQKTSSAELSEAINSMYRWYKDSAVCYTHFADFTDEARLPKFRFLDPDTGLPGSLKSIESLRWFSRGWTLQELIAPRKVLFFTKGWIQCGSKNENSWVLSDVTGISEDVLLNCDTYGYSVAQRMSWASKRQTTRVEDMAYCLLGIFDINMPLLYGEGERAFQRLQQEIVKVTDDESIYAWVSEHSKPSTWRSLFANSPAEFVGGRDIEKFEERLGHIHETASNGFTKIQLPLIDLNDEKLSKLQAETNVFPNYLILKASHIKNEFIAMLNCGSLSTRIGILVKMIQPNEYIRVDTDRLLKVLFGRDASVLAECEKDTLLMVKQRLDYSPWISACPGPRISAMLLRINHYNVYGTSKVEASIEERYLNFQFNTFVRVHLEEKSLAAGMDQIVKIRFKERFEAQKTYYMTVTYRLREYHPNSDKHQPVTISIHEKEALTSQDKLYACKSSVRVTHDNTAVLVVDSSIDRPYWNSYRWYIHGPGIFNETD